MKPSTVIRNFSEIDSANYGWIRWKVEHVGPTEFETLDIGPGQSLISVGPQHGDSSG